MTFDLTNRIQNVCQLLEKEKKDQKIMLFLVEQMTSCKKRNLKNDIFLNPPVRSRPRKFFTVNA